MPVFHLIRRLDALAVAAHLAVLPVAASVHEASHFRFEAGVILADGIEPCKDGDARTHTAHLDPPRVHAGQVLDEFLQQAHGRTPAQGAGLVAPPPRAGSFVAPTEHFSRSPALALPQNRSPPSIA